MSAPANGVALVALGVWIAAGVLAALVLLGRQGYRGWRWYAAGAMLGPLFVLVAAERADRSVAVVEPATQQRSVPDGPTVVVGVDGSPGADRAMRLAGRLFDPGRTRVVLVAVVDPDAAHDPDDERRARARTMLLERAAWFGPDLPSGRVVTEVVCGQPARSLRTMAATHGAVVVVVGRGGSRAVAHLLGDVAAQLAHHATVPVLLAEPAGRPEPQHTRHRVETEGHPGGSKDPATARGTGPASSP